MARRTKRKGTTPEGQGELPGVLDKIVKIPALTRILRRYQSAKAEYADAGRRANEQKLSAIAMMIEHKLELYPCGEGYFKRKPGKETLEFVEDGNVASGDAEEGSDEDAAGD